MTAPEGLRHKAAAMMPELLADLERLVAIPSVAFPGYPPEPVAQMADESLRLFREAGLANAELQKVPSGCPPVYGDLPGPRRRTHRGAVRPLRRPAGPLERELDSEQLRTQLIVALDPASTIRSGSKAELWFDTERMHVFDPATGENLTRNRDRTSGDDQAAGGSVAGPPDETVSG
jgi:hypothetical protein